jgi:hypothetical protein
VCPLCVHGTYLFLTLVCSRIEQVFVLYLPPLCQPQGAEPAARAPRIQHLHVSTARCTNHVGSKHLCFFELLSYLLASRFKPHAGEAGNRHHLASTFLLADSVNHGIKLSENPVLQYPDLQLALCSESTGSGTYHTNHAIHSRTRGYWTRFYRMD